MFKDFGFEADWKSFRAPSAEEREQHWLARYQAIEPQAGHVFLCDRSPLGDYAYNPSVTPQQKATMARELADWESKMERDGVLVVKLLCDPSAAGDEVVDPPPEIFAGADAPTLWRPMMTFGKREARAAVAADLLATCRAKGDLSPEEDAALQALTTGPGLNDLKSFHDGVRALERMKEFAAASGQARAWEPIPTKDRHDGRLNVISYLGDRLSELSKRLRRA
jgi:hypothetical protein